MQSFQLCPLSCTPAGVPSAPVYHCIRLGHKEEQVQHIHLLYSHVLELICTFSISSTRYAHSDLGSGALLRSYTPYCLSGSAAIRGLIFEPCTQEWLRFGS